MNEQVNYFDILPLVKTRGFLPRLILYIRIHFTGDLGMSCP